MNQYYVDNLSVHWSLISKSIVTKYYEFSSVQVEWELVDVKP